MTSRIGIPFGYRINDRGQVAMNADERDALIAMVELEVVGGNPRNTLGAYNIAQGVAGRGFVNRNGRPYSAASVRKLVGEHGVTGTCECHADIRESWRG